MDTFEVELKVKVRFDSLDDGLVETIEENIADDVESLVEDYKNEGALEHAVVTIEPVLEPERCWNCDGKGVGLDWGDMRFWECETCKGSGEIEVGE
ncbi:hypothetical protein BCPG3_129 [Bacillus phage BCPG3]|uniref:Uncharacterized protein n=2 Tax=Wphvirus TaxID=1922327 RepID=W5QUQ1_9CAUD|nr:hypothetical protein BPS13_0143 [Bacillus phage BPS13]YP_009003028.1 hypothetical protein BPS10C_142 [Bacillus phage BPS10C]QSJ04446.1 hypothetical protein BCPG3_129 [Bacillus phage BCPG3]QSJ04655.1 transactivating regulatory domain protein [Bacillus phage BCP18]AEZ50322.1 hypothetical protein BPS13_0143 [Bacillus phage BPS13]AGI12139.1 hypothetical protein BPS10C_142 [Bacillus phage BPS10C]